ncbi:MAG: hypothetical protein WKG07_32690 [Hymenobacter sp.]
MGGCWLRLNLLGTSTKDQGFIVHNSPEWPASRMHLSRVIDIRESTNGALDQACGLLIDQNAAADIRLDQVTILTKPGIPSIKGQTKVTANFPVQVTGYFFATEPPAAGEFVLQDLTPFKFPASPAQTA